MVWTRAFWAWVVIECAAATAVAGANTATRTHVPYSENWMVVAQCDPTQEQNLPTRLLASDLANLVRAQVSRCRSAARAAGILKNPDCNVDAAGHSVDFLYEAVKVCAAAISAQPSPQYLASEPTFYVFGIGSGASDPTVYPALMRALSEHMTQDVDGRYHPLPGVMVAQRGDWSGISSFTAACQTDRNTVGAIVFQSAIFQNMTTSYVVWNRNEGLLSVSFELLACDDQDHNMSTPTRSLWIGGDEVAATQNTIPLAPVAGLISLFSHDTSTTTTQVTSATSTSTINWTFPLLLGTFAAAVSSQPLVGSNPEGQVNEASYRIADHVIVDVKQLCASPLIYTRGDVTTRLAHQCAKVWNNVASR